MSDVAEDLRPADEAPGPHPIDQHVGARVRLRRTLLGMSQERLGAALGVTFQQVQKYERGTNRISSSRLWQLSKVLDVPVSFFFDDARMDDTQLGLASEEEAPLPDDITQRRETLELVRYYYRIPERTRTRVYQLLKAMASDHSQSET
jgi:transcriptional regulator with XRE-family HTH domain